MGNWGRVLWSHDKGSAGSHGTRRGYVSASIGVAMSADRPQGTRLVRFERDHSTAVPIWLLDESVLRFPPPILTLQTVTHVGLSDC